MDELASHSWVGDPTLLGWGTTFAYLLTFILLAANVAKARAAGQPFSFWVVASLVIFALGVNKQLDLQTWLHQSAKALVQAEGLYEYRRALQLGFVVAIVLVGSVTLWVLRRWIVNTGKRYPLAVFGLGVSALFVVVRAASIHVLDRLLGSAEGTGIVAAVMEVSALCLIVAGALQWRTQDKRAQASTGRAGVHTSAPPQR